MRELTITTKEKRRGRMKLRKLIKDIYINETPEKFLKQLEKGLPVCLYEKN